jgi:hypothetical protein
MIEICSCNVFETEPTLKLQLGLATTGQLNIGITSVRNKVFFGARFYCALLTLHVSAPFGGHLQVFRKLKNI